MVDLDNVWSSKVYLPHPFPPPLVAATTTRSIDEVDFPHVSLRQMHQDKVVCIDGYPKEPPKADAMITKKQGLTLAMRHADCQIAIFYDPIQQALGMAHSGWRGSVLNIYAKTIEAMQTHFKTDPKNIIVSISPSLSPECSEFVNYKKELPSAFWDYQFKKDHFDFWAISHDQLTEAGVPSGQIKNMSLCTFSNPHLFHSYRRDKTAKRNITVATLSSAEGDGNPL